MFLKMDTEESQNFHLEYLEYNYFAFNNFNIVHKWALCCSSLLEYTSTLINTIRKESRNYLKTPFIKSMKANGVFIKTNDIMKNP